MEPLSWELVLQIIIASVVWTLCICLIRGTN